MADIERGPSLIRKYVWLIDTIYRAKKISFKEINERWRRDVDLSRGEEMSVRTFKRWLNNIGDIFGLYVENERCGDYRYYIENIEDITEGGLQSWVQYVCGKQCLDRLHGHQGQNPAGVCAIGRTVPAAYHRCDEGEPGTQHHL